MEYYNELSRFLEQSQTDSLKTAHYASHFNGLKVKLSFGKGNPARVPWIAFLADGQSIIEGIYPFYLYFKKQDILVLGYGLSEAIRPSESWKLENPVTVSSYFKAHNLGKPDRYGDSLVFKVYDPAHLDPRTIETDLHEIIHFYKKTVAQEEALVREKSADTPAFNYRTFQEQIVRCNLRMHPNFTLRFISSLLTKPFVILTGLSGSGKTKLAQAFAKWICEDANQVCLVAVGADWTNREPLLGYPNALETGKYVKPESGVLDIILEAAKNAHKPYFLLLDEMNLSHVERYFADFLSAMESGEPIRLRPYEAHADDQVPAQIRLPKNLFIVGTVNIDETTYMFSPKVLDRANVIEFRVTAEEMEHFLSLDCTLDLFALNGSGAAMAAAFVNLANEKITKPNADKVAIVSMLTAIFSQLQKVGAEFGYRSAAEILRFAGIIRCVEPAWTPDNMLDAAIIQKLLPKVHGSRKKLEPVLKAIAALCLQNADEVEEYFNSKKELPQLSAVRFPITLEKLKRMHRNMIENGFTSFAEA